MFSKEDYVKYFLQIRRIERKMKDHFGNYADQVEAADIKKFFRTLERQEGAHARVVDDMLNKFGHKDAETD